jgi:hypothetical protein
MGGHPLESGVWSLGSSGVATLSLFVGSLVPRRRFAKPDESRMESPVEWEKLCWSRR